MTPSTETQRIFTQIADLYDKSCGCDGLNTATSFSTMLREAARSASAIPMDAIDRVGLSEKTPPHYECGCFVAGYGGWHATKCPMHLKPVAQAAPAPAETTTDAGYMVAGMNVRLDPSLAPNEVKFVFPSGRQKYFTFDPETTGPQPVSAEKDATRCKRCGREFKPDDVRTGGVFGVEHMICPRSLSPDHPPEPPVPTPPDAAQDWPYASWDDVVAAVCDASNNAEGRTSAAYLEHHFQKAGLVVLYHVDMPEHPKATRALRPNPPYRAAGRQKMAPLEIVAAIRSAYPGASGYALDSANAIEKLVGGLREAIFQLESSGLSSDHPTIKELMMFLE